MSETPKQTEASRALLVVSRLRKALRWTISKCLGVFTRDEIVEIVDDVKDHELRRADALRRSLDECQRDDGDSR